MEKLVYCRISMGFYFFLIMGFVGDGAAPAPSSELAVSCSVGNQFQRSYFEGEFNNNNGDDDSWVPTTSLTVTLSCNAPLSKVRVAVDVDRPIAATHPTHVVNSLSKLKTCGMFFVVVVVVEVCCCCC